MDQRVPRRDRAPGGCGGWAQQSRQITHDKCQVGVGGPGRGNHGRGQVETGHLGAGHIRKPSVSGPTRIAGGALCGERGAGT